MDNGQKRRIKSNVPSLSLQYIIYIYVYSVNIRCQNEADKKGRKKNVTNESREITSVTEDWGLVLKFSDASVDES